MCSTPAAATKFKVSTVANVQQISAGSALSKANKVELTTLRNSRKKKTVKEVSIVRSSAAEYLTFVAASGTGGVEAVYADESIWLTQKMMGVLYDVETKTVNYHLKTVFFDSGRQLFEIFE